MDFVAQACQLDAAPALGSFVQVAGDNGLVHHGVVAHVQTGGIDPGARAIMRGYGDVRDQLIYAENPDLPHVLRTTFRVVAVGFTEAGVTHQHLPARPARLHYSVQETPPAEVQAFVGAGLHYLGTLLRARDVPADELVAANVRLVALTLPEGATWVQEAGRVLANELRADYPRLGAIFRRLASVAGLGSGTPRPRLMGQATGPRLVPPRP